jgi:MOSC domain-containing protein YiiM
MTATPTTPTLPHPLRLLQLCVGRTRNTEINGQNVLTAIGKQPRSGVVPVKALGLDGDEQADQTVHGGLSKAVYAYPSEHLPFWQTVRAQAGVADWNAPLAPGLLGENLLLQGVLEDGLWIGDLLHFSGTGHGGCVLAVSEPRFPCFKFNHAMDFKHAARLMQQSGFCGAYLAVRVPGTLQAGDTFRLEPGPREVNVRELFRARLGR